MVRKPLEAWVRVKFKDRRKGLFTPVAQHREKHREQIENFFNSLKCGECPYLGSEHGLGPYRWHDCLLASPVTVHLEDNCHIRLEYIPEGQVSRAFTPWNRSRKRR